MSDTANIPYKHVQLKALRTFHSYKGPKQLVRHIKWLNISKNNYGYGEDKTQNIYNPPSCKNKNQIKEKH